MTAELDIVIPVYNEGENIIGVLRSLSREVSTGFRVLICYDHDDDNTLSALRDCQIDAEIHLVKNQGVGAFGAVVSGFAASTAPAVLVLPADDDYNAPRLDKMFASFQAGNDIVVASRFVPGGSMVGCPIVKATLVRLVAFVMHSILRVPSHDPTNGFRLFSRRVLEIIPIESTTGFTYSIELLVKCHRLERKIDEVPVLWYERKKGTSRFRIWKWAPHYLKWVRYAAATTLLRRGPETVQLKAKSVGPRNVVKQATGVE